MKRKEMKLPLRSDSFTHDLIEEILLRLPVRSLLRFKCVCKSWLTLISNPQFAKSHFDIAAAPTHRLLVKPTLGVPLESIEIEAPLHDDPAPLCLTPPPSSLFPFVCRSCLRILGSCRGFILLRYTEEDDLILWNPSTGARKTISCSPGRKLFYGFVYDTSTDDYLVFVVTNEAWTNLKADIEFFSLKTNSWNKIKGINFPYSCIGLPGQEFISGLLLNGALHWLTLCKGTGTDVVSVIIAFDLIERSLSEIPLPSDFTAASGSRSVFDICHFMVIGGCLALCCRRRPCACWVMKEYKVPSSWTKSNVSSNQRTGCFPDFPICLSIGGGIVGSHAIGKSMELDDKVRLPELSEFIFRRFCRFLLLQSAVYTESLQSFPSDFGEASKYDKQ